MGPGGREKEKEKVISTSGLSKTGGPPPVATIVAGLGQSLVGLPQPAIRAVGSGSQDRQGHPHTGSPVPRLVGSGSQEGLGQSTGGPPPVPRVVGSGSQTRQGQPRSGFYRYRGLSAQGATEGDPVRNPPHRPR